MKSEIFIFIYSVTVSVDFICGFQLPSIYASTIEQKFSLRRQVTFGDATTAFATKINDVWETSAEIPYWWRVTTQIWVVMHHQYGISALVSQTSFGGETIGSVAKCWLFFKAN